MSNPFYWMYSAECECAWITRNVSALRVSYKMRTLKRLVPTFGKQQIVPTLSQVVHKIFTDLKQKNLCSNLYVNVRARRTQCGCVVRCLVMRNARCDSRSFLLLHEGGDERAMWKQRAFSVILRMACLGFLFWSRCVGTLKQTWVQPGRGGLQSADR